MHRHQRSATVVAGLSAAVIGLWLWLLPSLDRRPQSQWPGVDEAVIGQIADAAGRSAGPWLNWVEGDLLLFMFLCAGLIAGFVIGYCARVAFVEQRGLSQEQSPSGAFPDARQIDVDDPRAKPLSEHHA